MASLLTIPLELLVAVSVHLTTPDLGALRLTCKQVERSLYEWFSEEFFTKKQFMLTYESLQALVDISKHVGFSKKLTHVIIASNSYTDNSLRFLNYDKAARYIEGCEDQRTLINTGVDREMLTEAFRNLPNLQTIDIRDFNSNTRRRDGNTWTSWGASTIYRETGINMIFSATPYVNGTSYPEHIYHVVTCALGKANSYPKEMQILLQSNRLPDRTLHIPKFMEQTLKPVLHNLRTLLLNVQLVYRTVHTHTNGTQISIAGRELRRFLSFTPNLVHLRLNFQRWQYNENEEFLLWLSHPSKISPSHPIEALDTPPIDLKLTHLDLGALDAKPHVVYSVIDKFASTLNNLSLWRIKFKDPDPHNSEKPERWIFLFKKLSNIPHLQLKSLKIGFLGESETHVQFRDPDAPQDAKPSTTLEYTGKDVDGAWEKLAAHVAFDKPAADPRAHGQDDDDDDDDQMDDYDGNNDEPDYNQPVYHDGQWV